MNAKYRNALPQLAGKTLLTDGGLETCLVFHDGLDLPLFAAFPLVTQDRGQQALDRYIRKYCNIALRDHRGFILDTPTWRASSRWATELGISETELKDIHQQAVDYLKILRQELETPLSPFVINGVIGPQDDGYNPAEHLSADAARIYHLQQIRWFEEMGVDMVSAITMTYADEAIGITRAAVSVGIPIVVSFTVETDGCLPSGETLPDAIMKTDQATHNAPAYFMINCAHPDHFSDVVQEDGRWKDRILGLRANASRMSHEELDNSQTLDEGDPIELGMQYRDMIRLLPNLKVMGGCCGTDHRHIDAISTTCH